MKLIFPFRTLDLHVNVKVIAVFITVIYNINSISWTQGIIDSSYSLTVAPTKQLLAFSQFLLTAAFPQLTADSRFSRIHSRTKQTLSSFVWIHVRVDFVLRAFSLAPLKASQMGYGTPMQKIESNHGL
jgi:hypothetical protein